MKVFLIFQGQFGYKVSVAVLFSRNVVDVPAAFLDQNMMDSSDKSGLRSLRVRSMDSFDYLQAIRLNNDPKMASPLDKL